MKEKNLCKVSSHKLLPARGGNLCLFVYFTPLFLLSTHKRFPKHRAMRNYKFISDEWHLSHRYIHTHKALSCMFCTIYLCLSWEGIINTLQVIWVNNSKIEFNGTRNIDGAGKHQLVFPPTSPQQMAEFTIILITTLFCRMAFNLLFSLSSLAISVCLTSISHEVRCAGFHH